MTRTVARVLLWAHRRLALYGDTRYLLLCASGGRKSGRVTIGESRLPAGMVLVAIRANGEHGIAEARLMWPQLSEEELAVLGQLAHDIGEEDRPEQDGGRSWACPHCDGTGERPECQTSDQSGGGSQVAHIPTRAEVEATLTHDEWCNRVLHPEQDECNCAVRDLVDELATRGWLVLAEDEDNA